MFVSFAATFQYKIVCFQSANDAAAAAAAFTTYTLCWIQYRLCNHILVRDYFVFVNEVNAYLQTTDKRVGGGVFCSLTHSAVYKCDCHTKLIELRETFVVGMY